MLNCDELKSDIEELKSLKDDFSNKLNEAIESGEGKKALSKSFQKASTAADGILEKYAYALVVQNINDPSSRNSEFLNSVLERHRQEQDRIDSESASTVELTRESGIRITEDTTINQVQNNLEQYIKADKNLDSNLVVYALKEKLGLLPNQSKNQSKEQPKSKKQPIITTTTLKELEELYKDILPESFKDKTLPKLAYLHKIAERVKNLEVLETENYIFMLPKDKWEEGKIKLPNPNDDNDENDNSNKQNNKGNKTPEYIAPADLTAILKKPVYYDWNYETDGRKTENYGETQTLVYDEPWVGKEIRHFPWSKKLIKEANKKLLKPNGFHIPKRNEWIDICNNLKTQLAIEQNTDPDDIDGSEISIALRERLNLAFSGYVWKGELERAGKYGYFWSASGYSAGYAFKFLLSSVDVGPEGWDSRFSALSVRCVSWVTVSKSSPKPLIRRPSRH